MIKKENVTDAWKHSMNFLMQEGKDFIDKDSRLCREILNLKIVIEKPFEDITKPIEILNESKNWVYPRVDEIANSTLTRKHNPGHIYVYGQRIFNFNEKINQIDKFIIPLLRKDELSRRALITLWNPEIDSNIFNKEVPSITQIQFIINNDKIDLTAIIRSLNLFFGYPANIYQIYILQEYIAQRLNKQIGKITLFVLSAHIFEDRFENTREVISK
jgi:thymidylate synthase (methanogen type)